jgi:hypothetical protein
MSDQTSTGKSPSLPVKATELAAGAASKVSGADALNAFNQVVTVVREAIQVHETESTKREKLKTYRETEVARLKLFETIVQDYFDREYPERRETSRQLFESLNLAIQSGDVTAMQTIVGGIVEVARTSPLAGLGNIAELRRAMDDPDTIFEL